MINKQAGMTLLVKTITRFTIGLMLIYGVYVILRGHVAPGGGFAGGVIIALSLVQLMLAYGMEAVSGKINDMRGTIVMSAAAMIFLIIAFIGFFKGQRLIFITLCDIAIGLVVGAGLFVIFYALMSVAGTKEGK